MWIQLDKDFTILFVCFTELGFPILHSLGMMIRVGYIPRIQQEQGE